MKTTIPLISIIFIFTIIGCETVHKTTKEAGTYVGKGAHAAGGLTEGAADGVQGKVTDEENPYGR